MDILNFISWLKDNRITTTVPEGSLIAVGVPTTKRDDKYLTVAMTLDNAVQSGCKGNTKHYELDITATSVVTVDTPRGIIDIINMGSIAYSPDPAYATSIDFFINNLDLDLNIGNRDNIYVQYSIYYKNTITDNAIPYLIATGGSPTGLGFTLYNANPAIAGVNNWDGDLYVYYELYTINQ
jgi:hypothetical protein